jgi:GAF domain-containing protein
MDELAADELHGGTSETAPSATSVTETQPIQEPERAVLEHLSRIGALLVSERDPGRVIQKVTDEATALLGAQFGAFFYNVSNRAGESYMLYTLSGVPREAFSKFPMPRNTAVFAPTFEGQGVVRVADITEDARYGKNTPHRGMPEGHLPVRSYLAAPVKSMAGEVLGGLFFGHAQPGVFDVTAERALEALAPLAGTALTNARLFAQLEENAARHRLLARASATFTPATHHAGTLPNVPRPTVPVVADWAAVDLLEPDGRLRRLAVHHSDPEKVKLAHRLFERYPPKMDAPHGVARVVRTGEPEHAPEIPEALLLASARDREHLEALRALGLYSYIVVPLAIQGRAVGAITFVNAESRRSYGDADVEFALELARRSSVALENANLYRQVRVLADPGEEPHMLVVRGRGARIDVLLALIEYQRVALDRAVDNVLTVEDVIVHKLIAWRPRDRDDVASILRAGHALDEGYIELWAGEWDVRDRWEQARAAR